jgi:hypothetical protein
MLLPSLRHYPELKDVVDVAAFAALLGEPDAFVAERIHWVVVE